ncbi:hypothetical protein [Dyadobacter sp. 676]|uniref:Uncharacterized protein n=1 Tax=Dyadobacter sp. 676 TaxID=3088362 RepID=A0AAU8FM64_9BACT
MGQLTLPPDYFRTAAEQYTKNPTERKAWLIDQIKKAEASLLQYQAELKEIAAALIELDAAPSDAGKLTVIGGVVSTIPTGYTQVIGSLLMIAGTFFAQAENKAKAKKIEELKKVGQQRYNEALKVEQYRKRYAAELLFWKWLPVLLVAIILWLIIS